MRNDPKSDFNACEDFLITVVKGLVVSAAMNVAQIPGDACLLPEQERKILYDVIINQVMSTFVDFSFNHNHDNTTDVGAEDLVTQYTKKLLSVGLFYLEYRDGIREGDGQRVLRCWKYLLPIFYNANHTNYSKEALLLLCQHKFLLTERQSKQLLYSRFINIQGGKGRNIPCDLHMEHLNRVCKESVRDLGSNKTTAAIERASKIIGAIDPKVCQFDKINNVFY